MAWKTLKDTPIDGAPHEALRELDEIEALLSRLESKLVNIYSKPKGEKSWPRFDDV